MTIRYPKGKDRGSGGGEMTYLKRLSQVLWIGESKD